MVEFGEWGVRAHNALLEGLATWALYILGRDLKSPWLGFLAARSYAVSGILFITIELPWEWDPLFSFTYWSFGELFGFLGGNFEED